MGQTLSELRGRFGSSVGFEEGQGGLIRAVLRSGGAEAHVYLHGAHVTHCQRDGEPPLLFMSEKSMYEAGKPIRGGVPICFPWFGPRAGHADSPMHGFARLSEWTVESADAGRIVLTLGDSEQTRRLWDHAFLARYTVSVGSKLELALEVTNQGGGEMVFEEALHTYLAVGDVRRVSIAGLEGGPYIDKVDGLKTKKQEGAVAITGETDRIYLGTESACVVDDPAWGRRVSVAKEGSMTTVVWNPWIAKAKAMADFGDEEWPGMLCIETCNVNVSAVKLAGGQTHRMRAVIA